MVYTLVLRFLVLLPRLRVRGETSPRQSGESSGVFLSSTYVAEYFLFVRLTILSICRFLVSWSPVCSCHTTNRTCCRTRAMQLRGENSSRYSSHSSESRYPSSAHTSLRSTTLGSKSSHTSSTPLFLPVPSPPATVICTLPLASCTVSPFVVKPPRSSAKLRRQGFH